MTYNTKKRKIRRVLNKTYLMLAVIAISSLFVGFHTVKLYKEIDNIVSPTEVHAEIKEVEIDKDIIEYFFEEAEKEGLSKSEIVQLLETIRKESDFDQWGINYNAKSRSWDLGYWQINTRFHPEVSRECSFNLQCSTKEALRIYKERGLGEWSSNK